MRVADGDDCDRARTAVRLHLGAIKIGERTMNEALRQLIGETQSRFQADPESAVMTFESDSRLQDGLRSEAAMRDHRLVVDEPQALGGTDAGPNPVELILAALGTCQEITYRAYATALGIPLDSVAVKLTGTIDLKGFFAVDDAVRPGYQRISGTVQLRSSASEAEIEKLRAAVNAHCPVLDIITKPVPVQLDLQLERSAPIAAE
jgi:uncharacterized OsmC-like protein